MEEVRRGSGGSHRGFWSDAGEVHLERGGGEINGRRGRSMSPLAATPLAVENHWRGPTSPLEAVIAAAAEATKTRSRHSGQPRRISTPSTKPHGARPHLIA